jgi:hypothetical protein
VKRWQDGEMRKRWTAAGMLQAEQQFQRIIGYGVLVRNVSPAANEFFGSDGGSW